MADRTPKASSSTLSSHPGDESVVHVRPTNGDASFTEASGASHAKKSTESGSHDDLWSSILNSVKRTRSTPVKRLVVLGAPKCGKSTLVQHLARPSPVGFVASGLDTTNDAENASPDISLTAAALNETGNPRNGRIDMGLSYGYFDVPDEDGDESIARVGIYQISSPHPSIASLLSFALLDHGTSNSAREEKYSSTRKPIPSVEGLRDTVFCILLDWESPWSFLANLIEWLDVIGDTLENTTADKDAMKELQNEMERTIRTYSEPAAQTGDMTISNEAVGDTSVASAIVAVSNPTGLLDDESSPMPEGCLTHNFGVPLVVICTKADTISDLERKRNFKEEQFDYIQQVLRTICLKYGAGLFFTAQARSDSYDVLREYILHRLFASPSSSHKQAPHANSGAFQFRHRASTVERDVLVVPAGWDSFGKIRALREGFDCASTANGWEWDVQVERIRRAKGLERGSEKATELAEQEVDKGSLPGLVESDSGTILSSVHLYEDIIVDWDAASSAHNNAINGRVKEPDEQAFLQHHFNNLQREPEPRSKVSRAGNGASTITLQGSGEQYNADETGRRRTGGVVGPVGSASLSLPSVERAMLERQNSEERSSTSTVTKPAARRDLHSAVREHGTPRSSTPTPVGVRSVGSAHASSGVHSPSSRPTSPLNQGTGGAGSPSMSTPKQSEVLHSFFQSLLKEKPASGGGASGQATRPSQSSNSSSRNNAGKQ